MVPRRAGGLKMKHVVVMLGCVLVVGLLWSRGASQVRKEFAEKDEELKDLYAVVENLSNRLEKMIKAAKEQEASNEDLREENRRMQSQIEMLKQGALEAKQDLKDAAEGGNSEVQELRKEAVKQDTVKQQGGDKQQEGDLDEKQGDAKSEQEKEDKIEQQEEQEEDDTAKLQDTEEQGDAKAEQEEQGDAKAKQEEDATVKQQDKAEQQIKQQPGDTAPPPPEATSISQENDDRKRDALQEES